MERETLEILVDDLLYAYYQLMENYTTMDSADAAKYIHAAIHRMVLATPLCKICIATQAF